MTRILQCGLEGGGDKPIGTSTTLNDVQDDGALGQRDEVEQ